MNTPFIRGDLRLNAYTAEGEGERIIFQHGLCGSASQTREAFPHDSRYQLATLECRGHGASEAGDPKHFSIATFANDVAAFITASDLSRPSGTLPGGEGLLSAASRFTVHGARTTSPSPLGRVREAGERSLRPHAKIIGGISMGAAIALHLAVHQPHLVKALILARPAWFVGAAPENMKPNLEVGNLLAELPPDQASETFLKSKTAQHLAVVAPDNLTSLKSFFSRKPITTTSALLRNISVDGPGVTRNDLANIKVRTLIIATELDFIHPMAPAEALHAAIPFSSLIRITPKAVDKSRYLSEFQSTLLNFFETVNDKSH